MKQQQSAAQQESRRLRRLDAAVSICTVTAIISIAVPWVCVFTGYGFLFPLLESAIVTILFIWAGWLLQALWSTVLNIKRPEVNSLFDANQEKKFHKLLYALLPILIIIVLGFFAQSYAEHYMQFRYEHGFDRFLDVNALFPYALQLTGTALGIIGIMLWMTPNDRIISIRTFLPLLTLPFICMVVTMIYAGYSQTVAQSAVQASTIGPVIYLICCFFVLNQSSIQHAFLATRTGKLTSASQLANIPLLFIFVLCMLGVMVITTSIIVGIVVFFRSILFTVLRNSLQTEYETAKEAAQSFQSYVFGGVLGSFDSDGALAILFTMIFIILILGVIIFLIVARRKEVWEKIKQFFRKFSAMLLSFFENLFSAKNISYDIVLPDYQDEIFEINRSVIQEYNPFKAEKKPSYRDFLSRLNAIDNLRGKLQYSYASLVAYWRTMPYRLKESDTPREIMEKVLRYSDNENIDSITEIFELFKYAEIEADTQRAEKILTTICGLLKRYYE